MSWGALVVAACPPPVAGQSLATAMLLRALRARGTPTAVVDLAEAFDPRTLWTGGRRLARVMALPVQAARAARKLRPHPVLFYLQLGHGRAAMMRDLPLLLLAHSRGWPAVLHIHGGGYRRAFEALPSPARTAVAAAVARAQRVIVLSESLRAQVEGLVPDDRIAVIPNGVEHDLADAAVRRQPHSPAEGLTVLYLSNLIAAKGYEDVLHAAHISQLRGLPHRFTLTGASTDSTPMDPRIFMTRHALRNTTWTGPVSGAAKIDLLAGADVFVFPPRAPEGQPIVLLEAMHFGLPLVTTAMGGIPDIAVAGENALFVPPNAPAAILEAVETLAADAGLRARMRDNSRAAAQHYTEAAHAARLLGLLDEVAGGNHAPR